MIKKVTIIGSGSWGTAIAYTIADTYPAIDVKMWAFEKEVVREINNNNINALFLPDTVLPQNITATHNLKESMNGTEVAIFATPSKVIYDIAHKVHGYVKNDVHIGYLTKGFSKIGNSIHTISQTIEKAIPSHKNRTIVISGPSHAEEVSKKYHTCLNIAGYDYKARHAIAKLLTNDYIKCRELDDIIGVELGGTLKNPAAIAAGIISVLPNCGDNLIGVLITEAYKEMICLSKFFNVKEETINSISGLGDLVTTALSEHSRNRRFGKDIALQILKKENHLTFRDKMILKFKPEHIIEKMSRDLNYLAEGAYAIEPLIEFAEEHNISIPVYRSLYEVLLNKKDPSLLIETIKNPEQFEMIFNNTKIQISDRKHGLEKVTGVVFKKIICQKTIEKFDYSKSKNADNDKNIIINILTKFHRNKNKNLKMRRREEHTIKNINPKNFQKSIQFLASFYTNNLVDNFNSKFGKIFYRYVQLCDFYFQLFRGKGKIINSGNIKQIKKIDRTINIIYVPKFSGIYDFVYLLYSIRKQRLPFPRFFVSRDVIISKFNRFIVKLLGGFIVDENKISNIVYREVLCNYIETMIEHGVPLLYFPEKDQFKNNDMSNDFFSIIAESLYKHTVEIALIPIELSYPAEPEQFVTGSLSFKKQMRIAPHINFSVPIFLSEYTKTNSVIGLSEIIKAVWQDDLNNFT